MRNMVVLHDKDNVGTVTRFIPKGEKVKSGDHEVVAVEDIKLGHKIALQSIANGGDIIKYGEIIGKATVLIEEGGLVHIQNVESLRGRGDKDHTKESV